MMRALGISLVTAIVALAMVLPAAAGEIHEAIKAGDFDRVAKMLTKDPSLVNAPDESDPYDSLPLHFAAIQGEIKIAKLLLKAGAEVDCGDSDESTPLHVAALNHHPDMVAFLLKHGADINRRDKNGAYALSFAASASDTIIVQQLIDAGSDLNFLNNRGHTLLHFAVRAGLRDLFDLLIERGYDINATSRENETVVRYAISRTGESFVEELLAKGADPNTADEHGWTPLIAAAFRDCPVAAQALINHGADVSLANSWGGTALHGAARSGNAEIVGMLIQKGADVRAKTDEGETPIVMAADAGNADAVKALLVAGADVNDLYKRFGYTTLHLAAIKGYEDVAEHLLNYGASWDKRDEAGRTAVELAARYGHDNVVSLLAGRGASRRGSNVNECTLAAWERPPKGEAVIWYLGHSGWAVKTEKNFLIFDYANRDREPQAPGLCNGFVNCDELAGENVTVFATHVHGDHYDPAIFDWRENLPDVTYVLGCQDSEKSDYVFMKGREKKKINGMKVMTIESNDTGVGFLIFVDGVTLFHAGDHANRQRDFSGPFQAEIKYLAKMGIEPDVAFMPISGCGFGDQEAVKMGVHYTLETLKPKVFIPMHAGSNSWRYHEFIADCRDKFPETRMDAPVNRGDLLYYREGAVGDRLALR